jgi:hypothetical protein
MTTFTRRLAHAALVLVPLGVACGTGPGTEPTGTSHEELTHTPCLGAPFGTACVVELVRSSGSSSGGFAKPQAVHSALTGGTITAVCECTATTGQPQGPSDFHNGAGDVCQDPVDVPLGLAGLGCTEGQLINGEPVWACPAGSAVPPVLLSGATACQISGADPVAPDSGYCEVVYAIPYDTNPTRYFTSSCLGPPLQGWELVWAHNVDAKDDGNSGCDGVCLKVGSGDGGGDLPPVEPAQTQ